jgi:hypothetical protein
MLFIRFYLEFNGIAVFEKKDVYREFLHNIAQLGGCMERSIGWIRLGESRGFH